jgi:ferredoxin-type protein NapF
MPAAFDPARRRLLTGEVPAPAPPWADIDRLHELCTRCGACVDACPEAVLVLGRRGPPQVDFMQGECSFCGACAAACALPIFDTSLARPWAIVARIDERCLTLSRVFCQSCRDACPHDAIRFQLVQRSAPQPVIDHDSCTGCGACVAGCPAQAITVREPVSATHG